MFHSIYLIALSDLIRTVYLFKVRRLARRLISDVDAAGNDWEAADRVWQNIQEWTTADPKHNDEFLRQFRRHHQGRRLVLVAGSPTDSLRTL